MCVMNSFVFMSFLLLIGCCILGIVSAYLYYDDNITECIGSVKLLLMGTFVFCIICVILIVLSIYKSSDKNTSVREQTVIEKDTIALVETESTEKGESDKPVLYIEIDSLFEISFFSVIYFLWAWVYRRKKIVSVKKKINLSNEKE